MVSSSADLNYSRMSKDSVLKDFQQMSNGTFKCIDSSRKCIGCKQLEHLRSHQVFGTWSTPIADLIPIKLKDIVQDLYRRARNNQNLLKHNKSLLSRWYEGRVVFGNLCVDATRKGISVLTVVEADDGTTCIVHVFNAVPTGCRQEELRKMFPKGIRVAISRPSIGSIHPSISPVVLYVQSPANLNFVTVFQTVLTSMGPHALRMEGNRLFSSGNFFLAAQYYTACFSCIDSKTKDVEMKKELVLAVSNRAEAWLKLNMFEKAVADANRAISIDPLHAKSFFRKGRALMALQEHTDARGSLTLAAKHSDADGKKDFLDALAKCKVFVQQSKKGVYNIGEYVASGCNMDFAPKCSDYVGPVEVRFTRDGRGRGLFVTRKVRLGELLLVSNNVAVAAPVKEGRPGDFSDLFVETLKACRSSRKILHQLYALQDETVVPNMKIFRPNLGYEDNGDEEEEIDVNKIQKAAKVGYFPWSVLGQPDHKKSRVWTLPAFINHSCLPNVSKLEVGKATLIHAARDLHPGDELLISYVDPYAPWISDRRRQLLNEWGFECSCKRCVLEKSHQPLFRDLPRLDEFHHDKSEFLNHCSQLLQKVESRLSSPAAASMSKEDKDMIRVTLFEFYGPFSVSEKQSDSLRKVITAEKLIKLLHTTAPGHPKTLVYMSYLAQFRDNTADVGQLLMDEFTAAYGLQCSCLAWKVLDSYFEAASENLKEVNSRIQFQVCKCWFEDEWSLFFNFRK